MPKTVAIKVQNLTKTYRLYDNNLDRIKEVLHPFGRKYHHNYFALRDVAFEIKKGESIGVIGRNGSGKSTLLKIITGVLTPTTGGVLVNGNISALLELGAGFNPELTGIENVYFYGILMGYSNKEMDEYLDDILSFADIGEFVHQPVKTYSSGMFVRLAFAVATIVEPEILIVDEALSVGDMYFQAKSMKKIKSLMDKGCTTLFVSHDMSAVKSLCSRGIYLQNGTVKIDGASGDVCDLFIHDQMTTAGFFQVPAVSDALEEKKIALQDQKMYSLESQQEFTRRVACFRKGSGEARIINAELVDSQDRPVTEASFGQILKLKMQYEVTKSLSSLVLAIYVKDQNQLEIIGTNNVYEDSAINELTVGLRYVTEIEFENKLKAGKYNISLLLADCLETSTYYDWIDNAVVFKSNDQPLRSRWALYNPTFVFRNSIVTSSH